LPPHISSPNDIIEDVLVSTDPSTPFYESFKFEEWEESARNCELDMSITPKVEHRDLDDSKDILQDPCVEVIEPAK